MPSPIRCQTRASALSSIAAARQVLKSAKEHLAKNASFAVETTLAGNSYLQMMLDARGRGYEVVLVYIGTGTVEINLARIRNRVLAGGHDVPEEDVRRRYRRSFENLPIARACRPFHPVRQLDRGWLSPDSDPRRNWKSVVCAKAVVGQFRIVNALSLIRGWPSPVWPQSGYPLLLCKITSL
jgi:hypothetical protein